VAEHSTEMVPQIKFKDSDVLVNTAGYVDQLVKEATEIRRHSNNVNRGKGFKLIHAWNPAINMLKQQRTKTSRQTEAHSSG
jgi:hypothetical protein